MIALFFVQVSRSAAVRCVPIGQGVVATCLASCPRRDHVALCATSMYVCDACSGEVISVAPIPDGGEKQVRYRRSVSFGRVRFTCRISGPVFFGF